MRYLQEGNENLGILDGFTSLMQPAPNGYWKRHDYYFATSTRQQRNAIHDSHMFAHGFAPVYFSQNNSGSSLDLWMRRGPLAPTRPLSANPRVHWRENESDGGCCGLRVGTRIETLEEFQRASRNWRLCRWNDRGKMLLLPLAGIFLSTEAIVRDHLRANSIMMLPHWKNPRLKIGVTRVEEQD